MHRLADGSPSGSGSSAIIDNKGVDAASLIDTDVSIDIRPALNDGANDDRQPATRLDVPVHTSLNVGCSATTLPSAASISSVKPSDASDLGGADEPSKWLDFELEKGNSRRFCFVPPALLASSMHGQTNMPD